MRSDGHWDAITIGAGLGGLAAAATLAQRGLRVLVLERQANFGGAATSYRHGGVTIEASLHETDGDTAINPEGLFARLGVRGAVAPIATAQFYEVRSALFPAPIQVPHGLGAACEALKRSLPSSAKRLDRVFALFGALAAAFRDMEALSSRGPSAMLGLIFSGRLLALMRESRRTLGEGLERLVGDDEAVKVAIGAPLVYFDDDPARMSFLLYAAVWSRYVDSGSYYLRGGSRALTSALLACIKAAGGEARRLAMVESILLDPRGRAAGVRYRTARGAVEEANASILFGAAAPAHLAKMLPSEARNALTKQISQYEPSTSLFSVSLGLSRPASEFGLNAYSTFVFPDDMKRYEAFPEAARRFGQAAIAALPPYAIADYGCLETGLRQEGDLYSVSLCGADRFSTWEVLDEAEEMARREQWMAALIADLDRRFPGMAGAVAHREMATARTMKNRLGTPNGEVYGFRPTPQRLFSGPPSAATPVPGLWISSAYTMSGGYTGALQGGVLAANAALRHAGRH